MARLNLVDSYLDALRERVRWRGDVDDLLAEAEDHLYTTAERLIARGSAVEVAESIALQRFGDPDLLARAFAMTPQGGLAVPSSTTRTGGTMAIASAVLWVVVVTTWWLAGVMGAKGDDRANVPGLIYEIGAVALLGAGALMVTSMVALDRRHGGLGWLGRAGTVATGVGLIASLAAWVFNGWGLVLTIGTLVFAAAMLAQGIAPRWPTLAFGGGLAIGSITWALLRGGQGSLLTYSGLWGEWWVANLIGISVGAILLALGLVGLGRWLRSEAPAEIDGTDRPLTA